MKLAGLSLLWLGARLSAAHTAHVYTFDPEHQHVQSRSLSPEAARLVLAQRVGVEEYHQEALENDASIQAVNDFGLRTPMFEKKSKQPPSTFIYFDADSENPPTISGSSSFDISPVPEQAASRGLFLDFVRQAHPTIAAKLCDDDLLERIRTGKEMKNFYFASSSQDFEKEFARLSGNGERVSALYAPEAKGSKTIWGTYEMPGAQSPLRKRQRGQAEVPLEIERTSTRSVHPAKTTGLPAAFATSGPLAGILPGCFSSQEDCESRTRNCTGHGRCDRKFTDEDKDEQSPARMCYACVCEDQISDDKKVTTSWGGPACQKKDVSVEFWLIALFSVGMVFLISFAIGSIWTMGDDELPSVIGAGVSGPAKRP